MALSLFNTLGRELQAFEPLVPGKVGFYGCGPTVYNYAHLGNMRPYVTHDILVRTLRRAGYDVTHVMNVTDVGHLTGDDDSGDDKMVKSAEERGKSVLEVAAFAGFFLTDFAAFLGAAFFGTGFLSAAFLGASFFFFAMTGSQL